MATVVACKLPHGLTINHNGQRIDLNGANADFNPLNPMANGAGFDSSQVSGGFGLTTLNDQQAEAFEDWANRALYKVKDDKADKANGELDEPFLPLKNGSILSFKNDADARKETGNVSSDVVTGYEGLDGDAEIKSAAEGTGLVESGADKTAKRK